MLDRIVAYVNYYFPENKTPCYDDNFIKACLVYKYLCFNLLNKNIDINYLLVLSQGGCLVPYKISTTFPN